MLIGETTTNVVMAADGAVGLSRLGVEGAGLLANGVGRVADAVGDLQLVGSGSGSAALAANSQLGAIGEDLSGFRPPVLSSGTTAATADIAAVEDGDVGTIDSMAQATVQQAVLGDVADNSTLDQFNTAYNFYSDAGYEGERLVGHLQGIDYSQPVGLTQLEPGVNYVQQVLNDTKGNYFADLDTPADTLGINLEGRVSTLYTPSESVAALQSTAAKIIDTWTVPGESFEAIGGGKQLFVPNKQLMIEVPSSAPGSSPFKLGNVFEDSGVNAAADQAFEQGQMVRRLSVRAFDENGNLLPGRTVLDAFGTSLDSGEFGALEFKLSENAPYTNRQLEHFPYLQQYGGLVVGNNGRAIGLPAGSVLDPFPINRINGPQLPAPGEWWK